MSTTPLRQAALAPAPLLLTPGPVMMTPDILSLGGIQTPYFRNATFSGVHQRCERQLLAAANAPAGSRAVFITGSGTAAMEAAVLNFTRQAQPVLVVEGGAFGKRFVDIATLHRRAVQVLPGNFIRKPVTTAGITATSHPAAALLINAHETTTGHLYDLTDSARYCRSADALHIVDAISAFGADTIDMQFQHIDVLILSSNKALGLQPGLSMLVMSPRAIQRLPREPESFYFDVATMLDDGLRGQTPFTPAVNTLLQLELRLGQWLQFGMPQLVQQAARTANYFRKSIAGLPLKPLASSLSNAITALQVMPGVSARELVDQLERHHSIVVAANGGELTETVFRVGHIGDIGPREMDQVVRALTIELAPHLKRRSGD